MRGMVAGLLPLPTRCSTRCPRRVSVWSSIRTAAASEARVAFMPSRLGPGAVADGDGLGDLQEPDQFEPVQSLGTGLVAVDLR